MSAWAQVMRIIEGGGARGQISTKSCLGIPKNGAPLKITGQIRRIISVTVASYSFKMTYNVSFQKHYSVELIKLGEELGLLTRGGNGLSMKMEG